MYCLGIDIGSSSVKLAAVGEDRTILLTRQLRHGGDALACLAGLLCEVDADLGLDACLRWCTTGAGAGSVSKLVPDARSLGTVPALTLGAGLIAPHARSIVEMGAQSACYITDVGAARPPRFAANDGCAAGTGSFFEDQMGRLGREIEDYSRLVAGASSIPRLSGRCAVFAKTDIIHRQQEGVPVEDILLGLCYAMVRSYRALIVRKLPVQAPVALSGGVLRNAGVVRAVREVFDLGEGELLADEGQLFFQAAGAALQAWEDVRQAGGDGSPRLRDLLDACRGEIVGEPLPRLEPLPPVSLETGPGYVLAPEPWPTDGDGRVPCALGIDVGSTSTNLVLVDREGGVLHAQYARTRGNPQKAVREGLALIGERLGERVRIVSVATTGSGRSLIGHLVGADAVRDEISAQARAAAEIDSQVDTVFEIGGQDSKYIALEAGAVVDFQMNKICAAGTGSFIEEQAARIDIPLEDYGRQALSSTAPVDLGERCTVFVETAINAALAQGAEKRDIAAGLCQSVIRNYLHRVVGQKRVGDHIVLQGGVNYNAGVVAAFKQFYGDRVSVSPHFAVSGAVGAALLAWEAAPPRTSFRGFDLKGPVAERRKAGSTAIDENRAFFHATKDLLLEGYEPVADPSKKTVGIPRCLMVYKLFPLFNAFFHHLGFNVLISDESSEETIALAQRLAQGETCYPVKLIHGHMRQLLDRGADYIFMPSIHTIRHKHSTLAHNYGCPYMHEAPRLVANELDLEGRGVKLLSPLLDLDFGQQAMASAMLGVGEQLGADPHEAARGLLAGSRAVGEFTRKTEEAGERLLASLAPDERVIVMVTRNYGIEDAVLNMGIPDALIDRGQKVITISHLHDHDIDISDDYPNVYWPFGQHILSSCKIIARDPRLFAVYLTNHGCGPDTMLSHLVAEEMGDKPYLQIEVDEHFSKVGVITRIEAFLNSLDHRAGMVAEENPTIKERAAAEGDFEAEGMRVRRSDTLSRDLPVLIPSFGPYGKLIAAWLEGRGYEARAVPLDRGSLSRGKAYSTTKEYLSFSALLGMGLAARDAAAGKPFQLLLPSGEGSDADGVYDRVVQSVMENEAPGGRAGVRYVAPRLERLPELVSDFEGLFRCLLAGDVVAAARPADRARILEQLTASGCAPEALMGAAEDVGCTARRDGADPSQLDSACRVLAVGEWLIVAEDGLNSGVLSAAEERGCTVCRMALSEYAWFLWCDAFEDEARFAPLVEAMEEIGGLLGPASPFAADPHALRGIASDRVGRVRAANIRYRIARTVGAAGRFDGVVCVSSMYENADIMGQLIESAAPAPLPVLHLSFDGTLGSSEGEKLSSFLYFLERKR